MLEVNVRFYEELNDYLPGELRKKEFKLELPDNSQVKDILSRFGIPFSEVHLVLVNGKNSLLETKLNSDDRISLFPLFESIDISPIKIINIVPKGEIIDTHVHLEEIEQLEEVLLEAKHSGVTGIIAVGSNYASSKRVMELSKEVEILRIYPALGIHPTEIELDDIEAAMRFIEENISQIIAIGEVGLDYWHKSIKKTHHAIEIQHKVFELQLDLAKRYSKPVIIHSRGAWQECYEITKAKGIERAVFHWYSGPLEILEKIIQAGYFISATPALEYSPLHRAAIEKAPLDNILVETDSPVRYNPATDKAYTARPKDVIKTLMHLSVIKQMGLNEASNITARNAKRLFNISVV